MTAPLGMLGPAVDPTRPGWPYGALVGARLAASGVLVGLTERRRSTDGAATERRRSADGAPMERSWSADGVLTEHRQNGAPTEC
jgi:hypothetical protein